jgi:anti-sigma B factor antagonist
MVTVTSEENGKVVVSVRGDVDLVSSPGLLRVLEAALQTNPHLEIDFSDLNFIDSSGLSVLVEAHRAAGSEGGEVVLRNPTPMLSRLLDITRLESLLVVKSSETTPTDERSS